MGTLQALRTSSPVFGRAGRFAGRTLRRRSTHVRSLRTGKIGMSQLATSPPQSERAQIDKLCNSIRGKLQFMDYLVRAAVADVDRFQGEADAGTKIFLRQLIEMHASNLSVEC